MNKIIDIIFELIITLIVIFTFSNGVVYFIKNVKEDNSFYLSILLTSLIIELFFIIGQCYSLKRIYKNYKDEK